MLMAPASLSPAYSAPCPLKAPTLCLPSALAPGCHLASPDQSPIPPSPPVRGHGLLSTSLLSHGRDPHDQLPAAALGAPLLVRSEVTQDVQDGVSTVVIGQRA